MRYCDLHIHEACCNMYFANMHIKMLQLNIYTQKNTRQSSPQEAPKRLMEGVTKHLNAKKHTQTHKHIYISRPLYKQSARTADDDRIVRKPR